MLVVLIVTFIAFFHEIFIQGKGFFLGDNLSVIVPHKIFLWENLKHGVLPLWNPHQWAGFPEIGDITLGLFNPFNIFHFVFPGLLGITVIALTCYFLSYLGTYLFLKQEKLSSAAALLGGLIFTFSGSMINISADVIRLESISFLPWTLLAIRKNKFLLTTLLLVLNFLVGQTQHFYMSLLFIFGFLIFFTKKTKRAAQLIWLGKNVILTFAICLFVVLPQVKLINLSSRGAAGFSYNTIWSLHPASLIRFFLADFWGRHTDGTFWGPNVTYTFGYVGFFTLVLIFIFWKKIRRQNIFFILAAAVTLFIALGKYNPLYPLLFIIPGFSFFRNPSSWLTIYSFALAGLLAFMIDKVNFKKEKSARKIMLVTSVILTIIGLLMIITINYRPSLPYDILKNITSLIHKNISAFHTPEIDREICFFISRNLFILGILSLVLALRFRLSTLIFVVFFDLLLFARGDLFLSSPNREIFAELKNEKSVAYLVKNLGNNYRFVSTAEFLPYRGLSVYDPYFRPPFVNKIWWEARELELFKQYRRRLQLLPPNIFVAYGLSSINGYSSFSLKSYNDYFAASSANLSKTAAMIKEVRQINDRPRDPTRVNFDYINFDDPRLSELSVKYILADEKLPLPKNYKFIDLGNGIYFYKNPRVLPRAQIYHSNNTVAFNPKIIDIDVNQVLIKFNDYRHENGDYLLLRDVNYPGWVAYDSKKNVLAVTAKDIFRKVALASNTSAITFRFEPQSFYLGLKISLLTLAGAAVYTILRKRKKCFKRRK